MIEIRNLVKKFGQLTVLDGISETINKGEKIVIIGPSGGGKSTFLRCLNLLETPTSGSIIFEGTDITGKKQTSTKSVKKWEWFFSILTFFLTKPFCKI